MADGFQHLPVVWKAEPVFLGHDLVAHPDGEFSASARNEVYVHLAEFFFEQVRHTGGARQVVSNDAITDGDMPHRGLPSSKLARACAKTDAKFLSL